MWGLGTTLGLQEAACAEPSPQWVLTGEREAESGQCSQQELHAMLW